MLYAYYWCENGETKLVKCSSNDFLLCIVGAFNIFLETALILKRGAAKWVAHAPDFVFVTVFIYTIDAQNTSQMIL